MVKKAVIRLVRQGAGGVSRYFRLPRKLDLPREAFDWLWWEIKVEWNPNNPLQSEIRLVPVTEKEANKKRYFEINVDEKERRSQ